MHMKNGIIAKGGTSTHAHNSVRISFHFHAEKNYRLKGKVNEPRSSTVFVSYMFICSNFKCKPQKKKHLLTERARVSIDAVGTTGILSN